MRMITAKGQDLGKEWGESAKRSEISNKMGI